MEKGVRERAVDISNNFNSVRFHGVFLLPPALLLFVFVVALIVVFG